MFFYRTRHNGVRGFVDKDSKFMALTDMLIMLHNDFHLNFHFYQTVGSWILWTKIYRANKSVF